MYNLTLPENCSSNCFDSIIYSALKYFNFDYEVYNIKYLYTNYFSNNIQTIVRGYSPEFVLKDIYNIDLLYKYKDDSDNLLEIVTDLLNNYPVNIIVDPYYCYWSPFYQKTHWSHILLIVDVDYINKQYVCFDVHYNSRGYIRVDFDVINNHVIRYFIIDFGEVKKIKPEFIVDKMNIIIDDFDDNIDSKKAELLSYLTHNDRDSLFPEGIETSTMLICLMWIAEDKNNAQHLLEYIEANISSYNFSKVYELLLKSKQNFSLLKFTLMRYATTGILKEYNLKNIIDQIFDTDVLMINELKNILGGTV